MPIAAAKQSIRRRIGSRFSFKAAWFTTSRELMSNLRAMGEVTGGPKPMSPRDRSRFLSTLDETVHKLRRAAR